MGPAASRSARPDGRRTSWPLRVGLVLLAAVVVRLFVASPDVVRSTSMEPTLRDGDVVLVVHERAAGLLSGLRRGDLVVAREPGTGDAVVKRVVGLPGDVVEIADAVTTVGGVEVDEPYVDRSRIDGLYYGPVTVPAGTVLVMGDNRSRSIDSRTWGPLPLDDVVGRAALRLWPWTR